MRTLTVPAIRSSKVRAGSDPLVMVTAYDAPGARQAHAAGVDLILVGDTLAMVVLGYEDTLGVTVDDIAKWLAALFPEAILNLRPGDRLKRPTERDGG